jgi:putative restriction endonuclease
VRELEKRCRVTGVERLEHLRASHIRPWRDRDNQRRLNGENGLLLTPSIDHLFDRGFISFADNGRLLISPVAHAESLRRMGIETDPTFNVRGFSEGQRRHLDYHREMVFLEARVDPRISLLKLLHPSA